jgi:hypothetical protein
MPLWGTEDTLEGKPKIHGRSLLDTVQAPGVVDPRTGIYATTAGWVQDGVGRATPGKSAEVLVAIRGLSTRTGVATGFAAAGLAESSLTSINFNISSWSRADGGIFSVSANFNEEVVVANTPTLLVTNDTASRNVTLTYSSADSTTNRVTFTSTIAAAAATIHAGDVLSIAVNAIALAGGSTIKDISTNSAVYANTATIGTNAGSITAVA